MPFKIETIITLGKDSSINTRVEEHENNLGQCSQTVDEIYPPYLPVWSRKTKTQ